MSCWWGVFLLCNFFFLTNKPRRKQFGEVSLKDFWLALPCWALLPYARHPVSSFRCVTSRERKWLIELTWHVHVCMFICRISDVGVRKIFSNTFRGIMLAEKNSKTVMKRLWSLKPELSRYCGWHELMHEARPRHAYADGTQTNSSVIFIITDSRDLSKRKFWK